MNFEQFEQENSNTLLALNALPFNAMDCSTESELSEALIEAHDAAQALVNLDLSGFDAITIESTQSNFGNPEHIFELLEDVQAALLDEVQQYDNETRCYSLALDLKINAQKAHTLIAEYSATAEYRTYGNPASLYSGVHF